MESTIREPLPARMLNEFAYCPRLFHLEWVQQEWADNAFTLDGSRVHKRVDRPVGKATGQEDEDDEGPKVIRSLDISDEDLGLIARIDLAEIDGKRAVPVDYKRGKKAPLEEGAWEPERVQLCAQALLLRAHGFQVERGILYFAASRRRVEVEITEALVERTLALRDEAMQVAESPSPPPVLEDQRKCIGCSLSGVCLPEEHALLLRGESRHALREVRARSLEAFPLHVSEPGSVLRKDGEELVVEPREGEATRIRLVDVSNVQLHGSSKITTPAMHALLSGGVTVSYLTRGGWLYGRTRGPSSKNVHLRIAQFAKAADEQVSLRLARRFVGAKIKNARTIIRRHGDGEEQTLDELTRVHRAVEEASGLPELLGLEGQAAHVYFRAYARILETRADPAYAFERRNRRPPRDPTNAMLSFAYGLLTTALTETVDRVGFDAYLGFYHRPRYGRPALALDLMEEFRPIIADSVVLNVLSRGIIRENDFIRTPTSCTLSASGRRRFIQAFERRLEEQIRHPVFGYRVSYRQTFEIQARLLGRHIQGEIDHYPELAVR